MKIRKGFVSNSSSSSFIVSGPNCRNMQLDERLKVINEIEEYYMDSANGENDEYTQLALARCCEITKNVKNLIENENKHVVFYADLDYHYLSDEITSICELFDIKFEEI